MSDINVTKKKGESFESLFRRFSRRVQSSGKMLTARSKRFYERPANRNKQHESAVRRLEKKADFEYRLRTGNVTEQELRSLRRRGR